MSTHGALVVFGSGPGIGRNVAALFAERGFQKIILLSRNAERLEDDAAFVQSKASSNSVSVEILTVDLADDASTKAALKGVEEKLKAGGVKLECVLYNAARLGPSRILEWPAEKLEGDLKISVVSLYAVAQWAMPQLLQLAGNNDHTPAFLVTSGMLAKDPAPGVFSLASCKAAQYNLVHSLHKEFEPQGVHCALNVVGGKVADESEVTNARNVAEEMWKLFCRKGPGEVEVVMMDPAYLEHVRRRNEGK